MSTKTKNAKTRMNKKVIPKTAWVMLAVKQNNMGVKRKNDRYKKSIICTYKWIVYLLFIIIIIFNFSNMYQNKTKLTYGVWKPTKITFLEKYFVLV